jgi:hypothetical protein
MKTEYEIGEAVWSHGDEYIITTEPYELHGGTFQDGVNETGRTACLATPGEKAKRLEEKKQVRKEMQEGFSRLNKITRKALP